MTDQDVRTYRITGKDQEEYEVMTEGHPYAGNLVIAALMLLFFFLSGSLLAGCALGMTEADNMVRERDFQTLGGLALGFLVFGYISLAALAKFVSCMVKAVRSDL